MVPLLGFLGLALGYGVVAVEHWRRPRHGKNRSLLLLAIGVFAISLFLELAYFLQFNDFFHRGLVAPFP